MAVIDTDIKLKKFLDLIAFSEGTSASKLTKNDGYDVIVTGIDGPSIFTDYSQHPLLGKPPIQINHDGLKSSAAGRYQVLSHFYLAYKTLLNLPDFSPLSQDKIALRQISERRATALIMAGMTATAITVCSNIWASFPGNNYGQGGHSLETLVAKYNTL
jgi:muramidase (phage lysozyme)